jgi:hypothetical protein
MGRIKQLNQEGLGGFHIGGNPHDSAAVINEAW